MELSDLIQTCVAEILWMAVFLRLVIYMLWSDDKLP